MARRPLPRPDPQQIDSLVSFPARPTVSPFCETVRILNRKVKRREVKKGRVILNLKVTDKPRTTMIKRTPNPIHPFQVGRHKVPPRNRVIVKNRRFGDVTFKGLQLPMSGAGFSVFKKTLDTYSKQTNDETLKVDQTSYKSAANCLPTPQKSADERKCLNVPTKTVSSSKTIESEHLPHPRQSHPLILSQSSQPSQPNPPNSPSTKLSPQLSNSKSKLPLSHPTQPASPMFSSSSSLSSSSEENEHIMDLSVPHGSTRRGRQRKHFSSHRHPKLPEVPVSEEESEDLDWRPEMAAQCANVVITDITTNLLTVTIKEFCHPPASASSCCVNHNSTNKTNSQQ